MHNKRDDDEGDKEEYIWDKWCLNLFLFTIAVGGDIRGFLFSGDELT